MLGRNDFDRDQSVCSELSGSRPGCNTDKNLLFGVLCLELNFISSDALHDSVHRWVQNKSTTLGELLVDSGHLSSERYSLLSALVVEHLRQHGNDAQRLPRNVIRKQMK